MNVSVILVTQYTKFMNRIRKSSVAYLTSKLARYTGSLENIPPYRWKASFSSIKQC
jgi:hypothetical protein